MSGSRPSVAVRAKPPLAADGAAAFAGASYAGTVDSAPAPLLRAEIVRLVVGDALGYRWLLILQENHRLLGTARHEDVCEFQCAVGHLKDADAGLAPQGSAQGLGPPNCVSETRFVHPPSPPSPPYARVLF